MHPSYHDLFQRNLFVFSADEQAAIRQLRVGIVGLGGVGSPIAFNLARIGVGALSLADPDSFEPHNINRQHGAYVDTIGRNKAEAVAAELLRINPDLELEVLPNGITADNVEAFAANADVVVDAIEYMEIATQRLLHQRSREAGKWVFTSQCAAELLSQTSFDPSGYSIIDTLADSAEPLVAVTALFFPELPQGGTLEDVKRLVDTGVVGVTSHAVAQTIVAALVVEDIIDVFIRSRPIAAVAPAVRLVNLRSRECRVYQQDEGREWLSV